MAKNLNWHFFRLLPFVILVVVACSQQQQPEPFSETYRSQYHFTPAQNWMNDPNGLVYHEGEYHLFYQHNPYGNTWGHMSWGHAVSKDLVHWQLLPVALEEENNIMIFSGSAVVDKQNTSGFGSEDNPPLVAIYTGHFEQDSVVRQDQRIAYSLDNGRSWTKYEGNPVIDEEMADFRDPKVFWHGESEKWVMAVALSKAQKIRFYGSDDLKSWEMLSEFGPAGAADDILWECPDLFELPVDGNPEESRWVLQVDVNPGAVAGGSGGQYFVGEFDGERFVEDPSTEGQTLWVDYGRDFYAAQSYSNVPESDGRRIWLAWMNNWDYAQTIPTGNWRSAMTIPRVVGLTNSDEGYRLTQQPVGELQQLRYDKQSLENRELAPHDPAEGNWLEFKGKAYEAVIEFDTGSADQFGIRLRKGGGEETVIGYDVVEQRLYLDRTRSGETDFDSTFASVEEAPLQMENNRIKLHLFVDWSSLEVFANEGKVVITDRIFPAPESDGFEFFSEGGTAELLSMDIWRLRSAWTVHESNSNKNNNY